LLVANFAPEFLRIGDGYLACTIVAAQEAQHIQRCVSERRTNCGVAKEARADSTDVRELTANKNR